MADSPVPFEIRVALIGHVSVGKTTVLNALLREKYSEVSMRRTTAGVNFFRIHTSASKESSRDVVQSSESSPIGDNTKNRGEKRTATAIARTAASTLAEIANDNKTLRNKDTVEEKRFDIDLEEGLLEMRKDTNLVLVDIPGINEAGAKNKYTQYVNDNWHAFDCVVLVMDGRQGVNTDAQVDLIKLVKKNVDQIRAMPVIILCNKIDDPDDEEEATLLKEIQTAVENTFLVSDRSEALKKVVDEETWISHGKDSSSPVLLPVSAIHAFIFRSASLLGFAQFQETFDVDLMGKLGRDAFGRGWKRFTESEKIEKAYELVTDAQQYRDGLEASNFHRFLNVLKSCMGGEDNQLAVISEQLAVALGRLRTPGSTIAAKELVRIYNIAKSLQISPSYEELSESFWQVHKGHVEEGFASFKGPQDAFLLAKPMAEILEFVRFLRRINKLEVEEEAILQAAKDIVLRQIVIVLNPNEWKDHNLSAYDWMLVVGSILLPMSGNPTLVEKFGFAKLHLEALQTKRAEQIAKQGKCPRCNITSTFTVRYGYPFCNSCFYTIVENKMELLFCPRCKEKRGVPNSRLTYGGARESCCTVQTHQSYKTSNRKTFYNYIKCGFKVFFGVIEPIYTVQLSNGVLKSEIADGGKPPIVEVPDSLNDPSHMGHLVWQFGQLMDIMDRRCERSEGMVEGRPNKRVKSTPGDPTSSVH